MRSHNLKAAALAALLPWAFAAQAEALAGQDQLTNVYQVSADETLWNIATKYAVDGVSVWQFLISIYQLNSHAFVQNDISRLRGDSQLFLPSNTQIASLSPAEAEAAFKLLLAGGRLPVIPSASMTLSLIEAVQEQPAHQVRSGETLWRIASSHGPGEASVWQMLMSTYQINLHAFLKKDISKLRSGSVLAIPTLKQATYLSSEVAELTYKRLLAASAASPLAVAQGIASIKSLDEATSKPKEQPNMAAIVGEVAAVTALPKSNAEPVESFFILKKVTIIGNESFETQTLQALIADAMNTAQNIAQLEQLAARITRFYQDQGYSLVSALLPAQTVREGNVTIRVIEAKYGQVNLTNNSGVSDELIAATLAPMQAGNVISDASLNTSLLLLSEIPGVLVNADLSPGFEIGSSNLTLEVDDGQAYSGSLSVDQYGDANMGKERTFGSLAVNNLAGHGDVLTVSGMVTSADMQFGRLAYDWLLNGDGVRLGAAYSGLNYSLGKELVNLETSGSARTQSVWVISPLVRSLDANVTAQVQYDVNQLKDHHVSTRTDRTISVASLTVTGDHQNTYGLGGLSSWTFGLKGGTLGFDDSAAESFDASTTRAKGRFAKINLNVTNIQRISNKARVYLSASGQLANQNLDSSEKMSAGGIGAVRAYKPGALSGDTGYVGSVEFRYYLAQAFDGQLTGSLFYDSAHVTVNKTPWAGLTSANSASISGAGAGLDWVGPQQVSAKLDIAVPTGGGSALVTDRPSLNVWLKIKKGF